MTTYHAELATSVDQANRTQAAMARRAVRLHASGLTVDQIYHVAQSARACPQVGDQGFDKPAAVVLWLAGIATRINRAHKSALIAACHEAAE